MRAFVKRYHLWPVFSRGDDYLGRLRWVLWRWWTWELRKRYRQSRCQEHDPVSVRIGRVSDFLEGKPTGQRVMCAYCGLTLQDFPA